MLAGLSGRDLAQATGASQSTVSRAERGQAVLSRGHRLADATGITGDRRAVLPALAEAAVNEVATFRIRLSSGLAAAQDPVRGLEASARVVRNFQPGIIPGLLQTAEYARRIMALADIGHTAALPPPPGWAASKPSTIRTAPSSSC
jgi:transcriptional regulator with XRE-family HTH domain